MHRFFVRPEVIKHQPVTLTGDQAHQVRRVLRLRLGDRVVLLDGEGWAYEAMLVALDAADVKFQVIRRWEAQGEPGVHVTLYQAVLKGERFGWVLQKGTEVGVSAFAPLLCVRSVVDDLDAVEEKRGRWERIIQEAAEQSGRGRLPRLLPAQSFAQAVQPAGETVGPNDTQLLRIIPWEGERSVRLRDALGGCNLGDGAGIEVFVGPEGGFTDQEIALAQRCGIRPVTLGPRILRGETAGIVAAALVLYEAGDL